MVAVRPDIRKGIDSYGRHQPIALPSLIAISWRQLAQTIDRRLDGNIYRYLETKPTAIRSIVINTGKFPPTFHSPARGSGRHHLAVTSPPAAGRIIEHVNLLPQAQREKTHRIRSINCANVWSREGVSSIETEQSFDRLIFEGYRKGYGCADDVIVAGLEVSQNRTVEMDSVGIILAESL